MDQSFEKRKKIIYEFMCDAIYTPMKQKEIAMVLQIPKEQRQELKDVLDALVEQWQRTPADVVLFPPGTFGDELSTRLAWRLHGASICQVTSLDIPTVSMR